MRYLSLLPLFLNAGDLPDADSIQKDIINPLKEWFNNKLLPYLPRLGIAVIIFIAGWFLVSLITKLVDNMVKRTHIDISVHSFIHSATIIILRVLLAITVLAYMGINVSAIITALGAAGVAVALALKDNLSNVASGLIILMTKPLKVGDFIDIEGSSGTVTEIQLLFTYLNTYDNKRIVIPNSHLTTEKLINHSAEGKRRVDINIAIGYDNDVEVAKSLIKQVISLNEKALSDPAPIVRMGEHGESAIVIYVRVWCDLDDYWNLYYDLHEDIKKIFDENHINIPYNQLDVHIKNDNE